MTEIFHCSGQVYVTTKVPCCLYVIYKNICLIFHIPWVIPMPNFLALSTDCLFPASNDNCLSVLPAFTNSLLETLLTSGHNQVPKSVRHVLIFITGATSKYQFFFSHFSLKIVEVDFNNRFQTLEAENMDHFLYLTDLWIALDKTGSSSAGLA